MCVCVFVLCKVNNRNKRTTCYKKQGNKGSTQDMVQTLKKRRELSQILDMNSSYLHEVEYSTRSVNQSVDVKLGMSFRCVLWSHINTEHLRKTKRLISHRLCYLFISSFSYLELNECKAARQVSSYWILAGNKPKKKTNNQNFFLLQTGPRCY